MLNKYFIYILSPLLRDCSVCNEQKQFRLIQIISPVLHCTPQKLLMTLPLPSIKLSGSFAATFTEAGCVSTLSTVVRGTKMVHNCNTLQET